MSNFVLGWRSVPRKEGTMPRGRGGGAFRAAKVEAQAEASRALIRSIIPYTAAGAASIETAPAIWYDSIISNVCSSYSHSMASVLPSRHSSCIQFSVPSRIECRQVTPCRASSASGTKAGTTSKNFFQTQDVEFLFLSQRPRLAAFEGSIAPKTPVLKLSRPLA